jgi:hypothetical protein
MRLDSKKVRLISPMMPGVFTQGLRFAGREKTVQLQETALVVEGNLLKVGLLGLELVFRRALAEWSSVTIPYSRITRVRYIRLPLLRLIPLAYLGLWFLLMVFLLTQGRETAMLAVVSFSAGVIPGLLAVFTLFRVHSRFMINFRSRDGRRTQLLLHISNKKLRRVFAAKLKEYRNAAKSFPQAKMTQKWGGPRLGVMAGLASLLIVIASGIGYLGWTYGPDGLNWLKSNMPSKGPSGPGNQAPPSTAGGTKTSFTFEPLAKRPGTPPRVLSHPMFVTSAVWLPNGRLATATGDGAVRIWDMATGRGVAYTLDRRWTVSLLALTPDPNAPAGVRAAFTAGDGQGIYLWSIGDLGPLTTLPGSDVIALNGSFDPTGRTLTYVSGNFLHAWDVKARTRIGRLPLSSILFNRANFTADGKRLVTVEPLTQKIMIWSPGPGIAPERDGYAAAALSPDGSVVAVRTTGVNPVIRLIDPQSGQTVREIGVASGPPWLTYAPGGRVLAGGLADAEGTGVGFWNSGTGRQLARLGGGDLIALQGLFDPTGSVVAVVGFNGVSVWRVPPEVGAAIQSEQAATAQPEVIPPPRPVGSSIPPPRPVRR